jgi:DNA-directed RNA polymerase sigma subunit (sigma70/sigma32)
MSLKTLCVVQATASCSGIRERELLKIHFNGREARRTLVASNLRLVLMVVSRYRSPSLMRNEDLISEGIVGLSRYPVQHLKVPRN